MYCVKKSSSVQVSVSIKLYYLGWKIGISKGEKTPVQSLFTGKDDPTFCLILPLVLTKPNLRPPRVLGLLVLERPLGATVEETKDTSDSGRISSSESDVVEDPELEEILST